MTTIRAAAKGEWSPAFAESPQRDTRKRERYREIQRLPKRERERGIQSKKEREFVRERI